MRRRSDALPGGSLFLAVTIATALAVVQAAPARVQPALGAAEVVAPGIELYRLDDQALLSPPGPVSVRLLRLDPGRVDLRLVLAQDTVLGLETVPDMALRSGATAAINAGFFLPTGEPAGLLKIDGELVSEVASHRGAVALVPGRLGRKPRLLFDQVSASVVVDLGSGKDLREIAVDAVDTVRTPGALVLFTPRFWTNTRTPCDGGSEFIFGRTSALAHRAAGSRVHVGHPARRRRPRGRSRSARGAARRADRRHPRPPRVRSIAP